MTNKPQVAMKAIFGDPANPLMVKDFELPCYVLEDGRRVLAKTGMIKTLGMSPGTGDKRIKGDRLTKFIAGKSLQPYISEKLREVIKNPIPFVTPKGLFGVGYEATVLVELCDSILRAREDEKLHHQQQHIAKVAEIVVRGLAKVGIIALIDEITGYQDHRTRSALQKVLENFISKELLAWEKQFPDEFYKEMFRLRNWEWRGNKIAKPSVVGRFTNDLVYERLAPGVLTELRRVTPKDDKGRRKHRYHQRLTENIGHPALQRHIHTVISFMKASSTWGSMYRLIQRALPKCGDNYELLLEWKEEEKIRPKK